MSKIEGLAQLLLPALAVCIYFGASMRLPSARPKKDILADLVKVALDVLGAVIGVFGFASAIYLVCAGPEQYRAHFVSAGLFGFCLAGGTAWHGYLKFSALMKAKS